MIQRICMHLSWNDECYQSWFQLASRRIRLSQTVYKWGWKDSVKMIRIYVMVLDGQPPPMARALSICLTNDRLNMARWNSSGRLGLVLLVDLIKPRVYSLKGEWYTAVECVEIENDTQDRSSDQVSKESRHEGNVRLAELYIDHEIPRYVLREPMVELRDMIWLDAASLATAICDSVPELFSGFARRDTWCTSKCNSLVLGGEQMQLGALCRKAPLFSVESKDGCVSTNQPPACEQGCIGRSP